jgi:two-component system, NarL family, sensor kinase
MQEAWFTIVSGSAIMVAMGLFVSLFTVYYQRRQVEQKVKMQEMEAEFQRRMLDVSMSATEAERRRIAQDLHDDIGALLSVTKLNFTTLHTYVNPEANAAKIIEQTRESLDEAMTQVRRISRELVPTTLERFGLSSALQEFASRSSQANSLHTTYQYSGDENSRLPPKEELMLYRVAQELINNAIKHSGGSHIHVALALPPHNFSLLVEDNGVGFNPVEVRKRPQPGLGLDSIEGRLSIINYQISYYNRSKQGCRAVVTPKSENKDEFLL